MKHLYYYCSQQLNPWQNQAIEEYLLDAVPEDALILYLWQNQRTVVLGKHQNAWAECNINRLREDDGYLARRISGGGCVYHDAENLNFTFLARKGTYDPGRQTEIILQAIRRFGLEAQRTGRNDMAIDGRKFSGNAYYAHGGKHLHHGTLLINTNTEDMNRYLQVAPEKLQSKGVSSVRSRVVNLKELNPKITVSGIQDALLDAAETVSGLEAREWTPDSESRGMIEKLEEKFSSWNWIFGRKIPFTWQREARFSWGGADLRLDVNGGIIRDAVIYSDAMDSDFIELLRLQIVGAPFGSAHIHGSDELTPLQRQMLSDIQNLIYKDFT